MTPTDIARFLVARVNDTPDFRTSMGLRHGLDGRDLASAMAATPTLAAYFEETVRAGWRLGTRPTEPLEP